MTPRGRRLAWIGALALIVLTNAVTLALVAWNRSGDPEARLTLSQREFERPDGWAWRRGENSGLELALRWRVAGDPDAADPSPWRSGSSRADWLDDAKLAALGFPPPPNPGAPDHGRRDRRDDARPVVLVLEFDGPAYQAGLDAARRQHATTLKQLAATPDAKDSADRRKSADRQLHEMETTATRLYVIDAGLDAAALRARYPDRARYVLAYGRIRPGAGYGPQSTRRRGYVEALDAAPLHVPSALRAGLAARLESGARVEPDGGGPRFAAEVAFGHRLEPWLLSLTPAP